MLLFANKARSLLTGSVTSAAGQVAAITASSGSQFVGVGGVATTTAMPMRCTLTAVDGNGNDTGAIEIVDVTRSGDNLTLVSRGLEGTSAAAWTSGTVIECRPTAGLLSGLYPRLLYSGQGQMNVTGTGSSVSLLPGGTALSIPIGFPQAGDLLRIVAMVRKTGSTASGFYDVKIGGVALWGGVGDSVTSKGHTILADVAIVAAAIQNTTSWRIRGDGAGATTSGIETTVNTAAAVLDIDITASATSPDTVGLAHYSVILLRGS